MEFAVIIDDKIEFCSNEKAFPKFEIAVFADMLIKELGEEGTWKLHKLIFHEIESKKRLKLLTFVERPIIICVLGEFQLGSTYGYKLLEMIYEQISEEFSVENLKDSISEKRQQFNAICKLIKLTLFGNLHKKKFDQSSSHEKFLTNNTLIYSGISSTGLPIISKLYDNQPYLQIKDENKKELLTTILSGQLATIAINSFIRAQCFMDSIQIRIKTNGEEKNKFLFFHFREFGKNNSFIFESLSTGDPKYIEKNVKQIQTHIESTKIFEEDFAGKLHKYSEVKQYLNNLKFNNS